MLSSITLIASTHRRVSARALARMPSRFARFAMRIESSTNQCANSGDDLICRLIALVFTTSAIRRITSGAASSATVNHSGIGFVIRRRDLQSVLSEAPIWHVRNIR